MRLWLDDERPAPDGWYWAKSAYEAIGYLAVHHVECVSLDHDLGTDPIDGNTVLTWMEEHWRGNWRHVTVHSQNPVEAQQMKKAIRRQIEDSGLPGDSRGFPED